MLARPARPTVTSQYTTTAYCRAFAPGSAPNPSRSDETDGNRIDTQNSCVRNRISRQEKRQLESQNGAKTSSKPNSSPNPGRTVASSVPHATGRTHHSPPGDASGVASGAPRCGGERARRPGSAPTERQSALGGRERSRAHPSPNPPADAAHSDEPSRLFAIFRPRHLLSLTHELLPDTDAPNHFHDLRQPHRPRSLRD